jgi:hypothetical protein
VIHPLARPLPVLGLLAALLVGAGAFGSASSGTRQHGQLRGFAPGGRQKTTPSIRNPKSEIRNRTAAARSTPDVPLLIWTGEQNGHLEPCGCSKPQLGGMLRRAGYLSSPAAAGPSLRLDNGDLTEARGRQDELKAETSIQLLNQLSYAAINLGEKEFRLGLPYLQYLASSFKGSLLCANARDASDRPIFREYLLRSLPVRGQEVKVAVVGLLSEQFAPEAEGLNPGLKIAPAGETLDRLRPSLEGRGPVILLFHGEPEEARRLVAGQSWIGAVIAAHAAEDQPRDLSRPGEPRLLTVGRDGKHLGLAELVAASATGGRASLQKVRAVTLGPEAPEDAAAHGIETAYLQRVAEEKLLDKVPRLPIPNGDRLVGTASCKNCHAQPHQIWDRSLHSHAWATLVRVRHDKDPDCVGCHTVGLGLQGGFSSPEKTPQFKNVGCENCHGPAGRHAANPTKVRPPRAGAASCASCHNPEQSPGFDFARFWAKIRH